MASYVFGRGICTDDINHTSIDRIKLLIAMAPRYEYEVKPHYAEAEEECDDPDSFAWYLCDDNNGDEAGLASILAVIIQECEGIRMMAASDCSANTFLVLSERYPWQYNEREKKLKEHDVDAIIRKYLNVLTDEVLPIKQYRIDYD